MPEGNGDVLARRVATERDYRSQVPVHVVWEVTLACNLKCGHCGSRAGTRRPDELNTEEALALVGQLAELGTRELTIIGGEAYLRNDWVEIIRRATDLGMSCSMQTGARALTPARLKAAADAGLRALGVSIDGLADLHDELRGVVGAYANAFEVLEHARAVGLRTTVNTQIGPRVIGELPALLDRLVAAGVTHWQVQLTVAMGNAADNDELLLQPYRLAELMPLLASLYRRGRENGLLLVPGNNIGYFGPYEHLWRDVSSSFDHWTGCEAGYTALGIEADGTVKGCPSLPTAAYAGGNVRDLPLGEIWRDSEDIAFRRRTRTSSLWGHCRTCYYAEVCDAGCTWTGHALLGRPGNNPYCHHRVLQLAKKGLRERIVKVRDASAAPFATGEFRIIEEPIPGGKAATQDPPREDEPTGDADASGPVLLSLDGAREQLRTLRDGQRTESVDRKTGAQRLDKCRNCACFIKSEETSCPFCGTDVDEAARRSEAAGRARRELMGQVQRLISAHPAQNR